MEKISRYLLFWYCWNNWNLFWSITRWRKLWSFLWSSWSYKVIISDRPLPKSATSRYFYCIINWWSNSSSIIYRTNFNTIILILPFCLFSILPNLTKSLKHLSNHWSWRTFLALHIWFFQFWSIHLLQNFLDLILC